MFNKGEIWAYPTDTSYALGVRSDDSDGLGALQNIKERPDEKFFSLMVADFKMLQDYAYVPEDLNEEWFFAKPRTAILKPKDTLSRSIFWPDNAVAFRITNVLELTKQMQVPVTATSANISSREPIYESDKIQELFGDKVLVCKELGNLPKNPPSEIWDFTKGISIRIR